MYACICHAVTEQQVRDKASTSCFTFAHYTTQIRCSGGCGKCIPRLKELINEEKHTNTWEHRAYGTG